MVRVLIIGNSKFPSNAITETLVENSNMIIACDGAIEQCIDKSLEVDYVIGDMDSLNNIGIRDLEQLNLQVIKIEDQNDNDLSKSINFACDLGAKQIDIIGVEGGSNQHQFASYWSLLDCPIESYIHLEDSIVSTIDCSSASYSIEIGGTFSVFPIGHCKGVCVSGSKWVVDNEEINPSSRGLHNVAIEREIEISCRDGQLLIFRSR